MTIGIEALPNIFDVIATAGDKYVGVFSTYAAQLLGIGVLISGTWLLLKESLTSSPRNAFAALMLLVMQASIAFAVITGWKPIASIVWAFQTDVSKVLGGSESTVTTALEPISTAIKMSGEYLFKWELPAPGPDIGWYEKPGYYLAEIAKVMAVLPVVILLTFVVLLILGLVVAVLGGAMMMAEISIVIGLAVAPLLIALNFYPYLSFTIEGMLRFFLGAILLKIVVMLTALLLGEAINSILGQGISPTTGTQGARLVAMMFVLFVSGAFLYVATKVDDIAKALMSGGAVGGPMARLVQGQAPKMGAAAGAGASSAAKGASQAALGAAAHYGGRAAGAAARGMYPESR